jgi:hypothetical protein
MLGPFSFVHEGRTYSCEARDGIEGQMWWWFTVSSDGNRYAPFQAASKDTRASIEKRIVDYYTNHLARRAAPEQPHWAKRGKPAGPGQGKPGMVPAKPGAASEPKAALAVGKAALVVGKAAPAAVRVAPRLAVAPQAAVAPKAAPAAKRAEPPKRAVATKRAAAPKRAPVAKRAASRRAAVAKRSPAARRLRAARKPAARPAAKGKKRSRTRR